MSALLGLRSRRLTQMKERLSQSPIAYRLAQGAFWSMVGGVLSRVFTMVSSIVVARLLGRDEYGELGMVQSTMGVFGVLAGFGLGSTATKYIAEYRFKDPGKAGRIMNLTVVISLLSGGVMMIACFALSPWLARTTMARPDLASLLGAGSLLLFISAIGGVLSAALSGYEAFRRIAKINILQGAATPLTAIPLVWFYGGQGAIASLTISAGLGVILYSRALKNEAMRDNVPITYSNTIWNEWPILWRFSLPAMASGLMVAPVTWISNLILVTQTNGYSEMGLFNAANQWRMFIIFLPGLLTSAMLPVLSETHGKEDQSDFRKTVALNLRVTWIVALPLTVMVIILGKPLAAIFGKQFVGAESIIVVLMLAVFLNVVNSTVGTALAGSGRMWTGTLMNLGWGIMLVLSSLMLVPHLGGQGLAIAYLLAYILHTAWVMAFVEIKLAPSAMVSQWPLILFSLPLLGASAYASLLMTSNVFMYQILLVVLSFIPLAGVLRSKIFHYI